MIKQCVSCGDNTTSDCIQSNTSFKKSIWNSSTDPTLNLISLSGLGARYVLKRQKKQSFKRPVAYKYLKSQVDNLNRYGKKSGDLFLSFFDQMLKRAIILKCNYLNMKAETHFEPKDVVKGMLNVIPTNFLKTLKNQKRFLYIIKLCVTRSHRECMFYDEFSKGFNLDHIEWLPENANNEQGKILFSDGIKIVLVHIILPLIHKLFAFIPTKSYQLVCVLRETYKRAICKTVSYLERSGLISIEKSTAFLKYATYLQFKPKHDTITKIDMDSFRIIALLPRRKDNDLAKRKAINKAVIELAKRKTFVKSKNFYKEWSSYVKRHNDKRMFMVKLDLTDCFGNICIGDLIKFIDSSRLPTEYRNTLHNSIFYQYVVFGKHGKNKPILWKWNHGLLQGMRFSSSLCEFYLSHVESETFHALNKPHCFIYRKVDDYFFASTKRTDVFSFLQLAKESQRFKINEKKTESNVLSNPTTSIHFCGMIINTKTFRLKCMFSPNTEMYKRFRFWDIMKPKPRHAMLDRAMNYAYNNFYFQPAFTNIAFNGEQCVMGNFFEGMVYIALKLDAVVMSATCRSLKQCHEEKILTSIMHCVKYYMNKVLFGNNKVSPNFIPVLRQRMIVLGLRAFQLVFAKRNNVYLNIIQNIQNYLKDEIKEWSKLARLLSDNRYRKIPDVFQTIRIGRGYKVCAITF